MAAGSLVSSIASIAEEAAAEEAIAERRTASHLWIKQTAVLLLGWSLRADDDGSWGQRAQRAGHVRAGATDGGGDGLSRSGDDICSAGDGLGRSGDDVGGAGDGLGCSGDDIGGGCDGVTAAAVAIGAALPVRGGWRGRHRDGRHCGRGGNLGRRGDDRARSRSIRGR
jgi:hypothetical protein